MFSTVSTPISWARHTAGEGRRVTFPNGRRPDTVRFMMSRRSRHKSTLFSRLWLLVLVSALLGACSDTPEERFAKARSAADDKDLETYAKFFTERSANFLRDMVRNGDRSKIRYLRDPFSILPDGDIEDVKTEDKSTVLKIKGDRQEAEVRMFLENDEWSIDVFSLDALWEPLHGDQR